ncbi:hypothetical protein GUITHDRAFT_154933 [Guillardia theta CCMP2712]|uniref:Uncharacterized protein n=1 Tax=Guillardia theta (strain CCMP2712) TaxID=905079 RepID=L1IMX8_GUITC|nr:hypothetical protein GUITHDRAFT_154933 [Guillardia theta CCMP2712]EKX37618.1 hypothetical protein GUITHDRAFT_154933 [Guillardia theta CCMP2712]|eukprot:XP_005824598.1 hypothetical protein GUITHDRAFT_154933 [Guillardia theta CCMP2712]
MEDREDGHGKAPIPQDKKPHRCPRGMSATRQGGRGLYRAGRGIENLVEKQAERKKGKRPAMSTSIRQTTRSEGSLFAVSN